LYFSRNRSLLVFASEPVGIFASDLFSIRTDFTAFPYFLKYKFIPDFLSPWQGIKQLCPGEVIEYWESKPLHYQVKLAFQNPPAATLPEAIHEAFSKVIPKDRPVGLMFSGGIDSSLILHWCLKNGIDVRPFSIRFGVDHPLTADQKSVVEISKILKIKINWVDIEVDTLRKIVSFPDYQKPLVADSAWLLTRAIAWEVKKSGIQVLLSGAGADEWFGGYRRHWFFHQWLNLQNKLPDFLKKAIRKGIKLAHLKWLDAGNWTDREVWDTAVSSRLGALLRQSPSLPNFDKSTIGFGLEDGLLWDQKHYLVQDVLTITDLATMEFGIEGRFPFLQAELTHFAEKISAKERLENGRKWLLKNEMKKWANAHLVNRKKQGFGLPLDLFFQSDEGWRSFEENAGFLLQKDPDLFFAGKWEPFYLAVKKNPENFVQEMLEIIWLGTWLRHHSANEGTTEP
jgi:asparagine synthase (glutamine-hydrolysing)